MRNPLTYEQLLDVRGQVRDGASPSAVAVAFGVEPELVAWACLGVEVRNTATVRHTPANADRVRPHPSTWARQRTGAFR